MTNKVGIFGGSFNPIHTGHINSMLTVADELKLSVVKVVPSNITPLKSTTEEGPEVNQRLLMVELAIREYPEVLELDDVEVKRSGTSYTVDTVNEYLENSPADELYLIIGADQFEQFDQWKDYQEILEKVNLVVTTRPGSFLPFGLDDFPQGIQPMVEIFDTSLAALKSGKSIYFVQLKDKDVSATEIRKRLRSDRSVTEFIDAEVERFLREGKLYNTVGPKIGDYERFTEFCAQILFNKKALDVVGYDLTQLEMPSEYTLVASGTSKRHASALADNVIRAAKDEFGVFPYNIEGKEDGRWVVLDYGSLIVHLFYDYVRVEYRLEDLWTEGKRLNLVDKAIK